MEPLHTGEGSRPVPDPTVLTTAALAQAIAALRELTETRMNGEIKVLEARLASMDEAVRLLQSARDNHPTELEQIRYSLMAVVNERFNTEHEHDKVVEEKFGNVATEFILRDAQVKETAVTSKSALDAALAAQKEAAATQNASNQAAIDKSTEGIEKQLATQTALQDRTAENLRREIADLREWKNRVEGAGLSTTTARAEGHTNNSFFLSLFVAGLSLVGLVAVLVKDLAR